MRSVGREGRKGRNTATKIMTLKQLIERQIEFNEWANRRYVEWLSALPGEVLTREFESSFPTIIATVKHILEAQSFWSSVLTGSGGFERMGGDLTAEQIFDELVENSRLLVEYCHSATEEDLTKTVKIDNQWIKCGFEKAEYVQQFVAHAAYHRGQIVTMTRAFGISGAPSADFIVFLLSSGV